MNFCSFLETRRFPLCKTRWTCKWTSHLCEWDHQFPNLYLHIYICMMTHVFMNRVRAIVNDPIRILHSYLGNLGWFFILLYYGLGICNKAIVVIYISYSNGIWPLKFLHIYIFIIGMVVIWSFWHNNGLVDEFTYLVLRNVISMHSRI